MWLILAFLSATLLGFYDAFKKKALSGNAVIPVLFLNTLFSSLIFVPFIVTSYTTNPCRLWRMGSTQIHHSEKLYRAEQLDFRLLRYEASAPYHCGTYQRHTSCNDTRGSHACIWRGTQPVPMDRCHLSSSFIPHAVGLDRMIVQSWYNIYQLVMMGFMMMILWWPARHKTTPFRWHRSIIFISIFLSAADFVYFYALSLPGAMISIVSMVRRGSVIVSFLFGAALFHEKNLKAKFVDLLLVLIGMLFLYFGSK